MANILLKNVVSAAPSTFNLIATMTTDTHIEGGSSSRDLQPASVQFSIQDSLGNPIDATAGTITPTFKYGVHIVDAEGNPQFSDVGNLTVNPVLSVAGQCTLNMPFQSGASQPPGNYPAYLIAIDSAGGTSQLLAKGQVVLQSSP